MKHDQLYKRIKQIIDMVTKDTHPVGADAELLVALKELIDSEESAWQMLDDLKAADVAQHQEHLKAALNAALAAHNPHTAGKA